MGIADFYSFPLVRQVVVEHLEKEVLKFVFLVQKKSVKEVSIFIHWKYVSEIYTQTLRSQGSWQALY